VKLGASSTVRAMESALRVDTAGVQVMAGRWHGFTGDLSGGSEPGAGLGLSCQPSAAAMNAGHADVTACTAVLAERLRGGAARVAAADSRYAANEADSTAALTAVVDSETVH
jgi:hypothetical protein